MIHKVDPGDPADGHTETLVVKETKAGDQHQ